MDLMQYLGKLGRAKPTIKDIRLGEMYFPSVKNLAKSDTGIKIELDINSNN